ARMQLACEEHAADLTKAFQGLVSGGLLERHGQKRGTYYRIPTSSPHNGGSSPHEGVGDASLKAAEEAELLRIAQPAREKKRLRPEQMRQIIRDLCDGRYLTAARLAALVQRDAANLQGRVLAPMLAEKTLKLQFPDYPTHPQQG